MIIPIQATGQSTQTFRPQRVLLPVDVFDTFLHYVY